MSDQAPLTFPRPRFVQAIRRADGRVDLYFRKEGAARVKLVSADRSDDLRWEVFELVLAAAMHAPPPPRPLGFTTWVDTYAASAEFKALGDKTQLGYWRWLKAFKADFGDLLLEDFDAAFVMALRDGWAKRGYRAANVGLQVLKNVLERPLITGALKTDPFTRIRKAPRPSTLGEPHPAWRDEEVEAAIAAALEARMFGLARAIGLGRWGGFRRQSICRVRRNARTWADDPVRGRHRRIVWVTEKRKVLADKPEDARLTQLLADTPDRALTIAYNARDGVWQERQLNQALERLLTPLAASGAVRGAPDAEGIIRPVLTLHGLRHARGVELASSGASDAEIMAQIDHATPRAAAIYRRQAERRGLADSAQTKVDNIVALAAARRIAEAGSG